MEPVMHERERWQIIMQLVRERGVVRIGEIVGATGASSATVRRDFGKLAAQRLVRRVHGGVEIGETARQGVFAAPELEGRAFEVSRTLNVDRKRAIAEAAAGLCIDGQSIIINAGSTTYEMVAPLERRRLTILTNSMPIAAALMARGSNRVIVPGGEIHRKQAIILSPFDNDAIQHTTAAVMFMSCWSLGPMGVIESDPLIAHAESKLLNRADKLVVLVDGSKFEARGSIVVCPLSRVSTVVTDDSAPPSAVEMLQNHGIHVIVAKTRRSSSEHAAAIA
jgi:DeoR family ulaG and ulaABCDEF operon transcriptional repressor